MSEHIDSQLRDQNPETMPLEELMALANAAPETEEVFDVVDPAPAQPRNPDGTFASTTPTPEVPPVAEAISSPPVPFTRTIDLGDGSGSQVFSADTLEGLVDKLADAQKHATIKIRDQNRIIKTTPKLPAKKELTSDEKYLLGQRFISDPTEAVKEALESEFGMSFDEIKESTLQARRITQERVNQAVGKQWIAATPEYFVSEPNNRRVDAYIIRMFGGEFSQENLSAAYQDLKASGLLQEKPAAAPPVVPVVAAPPAPRARASSLSSRISTVAAPPSGHTEADLYKMPLHELEALANQRG